MSARTVRFTLCLGFLFALQTVVPGTVIGQAKQAAGSQGLLPRGLFHDVTLQELDRPALKSEKTALTLSLATTVLPVALGGVMMALGDAESGVSTAGSLIAGLGLYLGPATGYWYGGASGRGWKGFGIRFGTALAAGVALYAICVGGDSDCSIAVEDEGTTAAAGVVALAATGVILFSAIWDIAKVKSHVRKANDEKLAEHGARLSVIPVLNPLDGGSAGLVASIRF